MMNCPCRPINTMLSFILLLFTCKVQTEEFTLVPKVIVFGGPAQSSNLTFSCRPNRTDVTRVLAMEIGIRSPNGGPDKAIVQISIDNPEVDVKDVSLLPRMSYNGSLNGAVGYLDIVLSELQCSDAATYYCDFSIDALGITTVDISYNVSAMSYPGDITLFASPDRTIYDANTVVEFTCNGRIGNRFDENMADFWIWEWRALDMTNTQWTPYPYRDNITYNDPVPSGSCQYFGRSTLTHLLRRTDNGKQFRCYVVSKEYGGNKTLYLELPVTTQVPSGPAGTQKPEATTVGMWIVCVIFFLT